MSSPVPDSVPPGAPVVPQGPVPAVGIPNSQDYPRLVYTAPRFEVVAIADIIAPSVLEACEALLPSLVPPYVDAAADAAVASLAVVLTGSTMTGPLNLSPTMPTAASMAATKAYVDTMISTVIPEVPPVPVGQAWARETGQWIPLAGGGSVTNIATGAGLTGGPITVTGTIAMANMAGNTLKGNNTGTLTAPTDLNVGQVMTMLGAAPLNSPVFTGAPTLPSGTQAVTQPGGTNNTTVATTAFVAAASVLALPLTGGTLAGPGNLTIRGGVLVGAAGAVPAAGALTINSAANPPQAAGVPPQLWTVAEGGYAYTLQDAYSAAQYPLLQGRRSRGTAAAPSAVQANDTRVAIGGVGRGATGYFGGVSWDAIAAENWTDTAQGSYVTVKTNAPGQTGLTVRETIRQGVLIGNPAPDPGQGALILNANAVPPPGPVLPGGTSLNIIAADGAPARVLLDTFGINPALSFRLASGTAAAPTAIINGAVIGQISIFGRGATAYSTNRGGINWAATENWSDTANGNQVNFLTTPNGSTTPVASLGLSANNATFSGVINSAPPASVDSELSLTGTATAGGHQWLVLTKSSAAPVGEFWIYDITAGALRLEITTAGACFASSAWGVISDATVKTDIVDHPRGLSEILQLQPRQFTYTGEHGLAGDGTGLIAQELEGIMPELVREMPTGDGGTVKTIVETGVIWPLINAVKELASRLEALEVK